MSANWPTAIPVCEHVVRPACVKREEQQPVEQNHELSTQPVWWSREASCYRRTNTSNLVKFRVDLVPKVNMPVVA